MHAGGGRPVRGVARQDQLGLAARARARSRVAVQEQLLPRVRAGVGRAACAWSAGDVRAGRAARGLTAHAHESRAHNVRDDARASATARPGVVRHASGGS